MSKTMKTIITAVVILVVGLGLFFTYDYLMGKYENQGGQGITNSGTNEEAPDFTMTDVNGKSVKLSDFKGKAVVLNFSTSWCTYCKQEKPTIEEAYKKYGDQVAFLMVDLVGVSGDTAEKFKAHIDEKGYTFPIYFDNDQEGMSAFGINSFPQTFFIDKEGKITHTTMGAIQSSELESAITDLLK